MDPSQPTQGSPCKRRATSVDNCVAGSGLLVATAAGAQQPVVCSDWILSISMSAVGTSHHPAALW